MLKFFWESIKNGLSMWYGWLAAISTIGGIILWILSKVVPKIKVPILIYKILIIILLLLFVWGLSLGTFKVYQQKDKDLELANKKITDLEEKISKACLDGFSTPDQLIGPYLEGIDFRIVDLARENLVIRNRTIKNCRIYGPAVLLLKTGSIGYCVFDGDPNKTAEENVNSIYFPLIKSDVIRGVIAVENVDFKNCVFNGVAFMGPEPLREMLISSISKSRLP